MEYSEEPRLTFTPLTPKDYSIFYDLEMKSYTKDAPFYQSFLQITDNILELGCGSGRLTRLLASSCETIAGLDLSEDMVNLANKKVRDNTSYHCMDMTDFNFPKIFDSILIPYNTLNLLGEKDSIFRCLQLCKKHLKDSGNLLLHLYHPDHKILSSAGERTFQFDIFEQNTDIKVIKETLKNYCLETSTLTLEERYRVRSSKNTALNRDLRHFLKLYCPTFSQWKELILSSGLYIENHWGGYNLSPFDDATDTLLLVHAYIK